MSRSAERFELEPSGRVGAPERVFRGAEVLSVGRLAIVGTVVYDRPGCGRANPSEGYPVFISFA